MSRGRISKWKHLSDRTHHPCSPDSAEVLVSRFKVETVAERLQIADMIGSRHFKAGGRDRAIRRIE